MYSANGTGCRLTYSARDRSSGPTGCRRCCGGSAVGPVQDRADQDRRADRLHRRGRSGRRRPGRANGSRSEAFSGQSTRSGCGTRAGLDVGGQRAASRRRGCPAPAGRRASKCEPAVGHVALDDRDDGSRGPDGAPARTRRPAPAPATAAATTTPAAATRRGRGPAARGAGDDAAASPAPVSATAKVTSGAPPSAANQRSGESGWLKASRPHGKPPNGSRSRSASCGHPRARRPTAGTAAAVASDGQDGTERGHEARPRRAARISHGAGADVDAGPVQQRDEEPEPVEQAEPGAGAGPSAVDCPRQSGDAEHGQRPDAQAREMPRRQRSRRPARRRSPPDAERRWRCRAPGRAMARASVEYHRGHRPGRAGSQCRSPEQARIEDRGAVAHRCQAGRQARPAAPGRAARSSRSTLSASPDREGGRLRRRPARRPTRASRPASHPPGVRGERGGGRRARTGSCGCGGRPHARPTAPARSPGRPTRTRAARRRRRGRRTRFSARRGARRRGGRRTCRRRRPTRRRTSAASTPSRPDAASRAGSRTYLGVLDAVAGADRRARAGRTPARPRRAPGRPRRRRWRGTRPAGLPRCTARRARRRRRSRTAGCRACRAGRSTARAARRCASRATRRRTGRRPRRPRRARVRSSMPNSSPQ